MPVIKRINLREQVRELILQRIGHGKYGPGHRLVESNLAQELQVSTVPVREAIRELVAIGVLDFESHKGARVREVGVAETIEALLVKEALEPLAIRLAGAQIRDCCPALRAACDQILAAARAGDLAAFQDYNQTFHHIIVQASGNSVLQRTWAELAFEVRTRFILEYLEGADCLKIAMEHSPIVEAFEQGDTDRAAHLLASHSHHLVEYLKTRLESKPAAQPALEKKVVTLANGGTPFQETNSDSPTSSKAPEIQRHE